jgi:hypothetical protein
MQRRAPDYNPNTAATLDGSTRITAHLHHREANARDRMPFPKIVLEYWSPTRLWSPFTISLDID